jgi:hypothetical protein
MQEVADTQINLLTINANTNSRQEIGASIINSAFAGQREMAYA